MGSFNKKSEFRKAENIDKPISSNERFNVTNDPHLSLLAEFWGNIYAHVILTGEADSQPTDAKELLHDCGFGGMPFEQKQRSVSSRQKLIHLDFFYFCGNQMLVTEMDMPQSLNSKFW